MNFLKKYNPKHYQAFLSVVTNIIGDNEDLHTWVKNLGMNDILVWLKSIQHVNENNNRYFEESCILTTLVIKLFSLELDIEDVELKNSEIEKLINRTKKVLLKEVSYRNDVIEKPERYSILKDID